MQRVAGRLHHVAFSSGHRHAGSLPGEQQRRALTDRARASQHDGPLSDQGTAMRQPGHRGRGRGVRAIAVEHDGDAEFGEELPAHRGEHRGALGHTAAADENGGIFLVPGGPGENGALDQPAHVVRVHAAVRRHVVGAAVVAHDIVEDRRKGVGVELIEEFFHSWDDAARQEDGLMLLNAAACRPPTARYYRSTGRQETAWPHPKPRPHAA